jgi:hypothetical protein
VVCHNFMAEAKSVLRIFYYLKQLTYKHLFLVKSILINIAYKLFVISTYLQISLEKKVEYP